MFSPKLVQFPFLEQFVLPHRCQAQRAMDLQEQLERLKLTRAVREMDLREQLEDLKRMCSSDVCPPSVHGWDVPDRTWPEVGSCWERE